MVLESDIMIKNLQEELTCTLDIISCSSAQTKHLGMRLGALLHGGELILLNGQLGSGKTTFTQGLAEGMRITDIVSSPTFTLLKEYRSQFQPVSDETNTAEVAAKRLGPMQSEVHSLYHFDLYRLDDPDEIIDLGFEDYFYNPNPGSDVCVVEWADKADAFWPAERLSICFNALDEARRCLLFVATGTHYCELLRQFSEENICDY